MDGPLQSVYHSEQVMEHGDLVVTYSEIGPMGNRLPILRLRFPADGRHGPELALYARVERMDVAIDCVRYELAPPS